MCCVAGVPSDGPLRIRDSGPVRTAGRAAHEDLRHGDRDGRAVRVCGTVRSERARIQTGKTEKKITQLISSHS